MNLEDQVVNLELAKRLKELAVKQEGIFCWARQGGFKNWGLELFSSKPELQRMGRDYYVAFTCAELGEMLPKELRSSQFGRDVGFYYTQIPDVSCTKWIIFYRNTLCSLRDCEVEDENEANARAKILIYLLENGLMKNEKI